MKIYTIDPSGAGIGIFFNDFSIPLLLIQWLLHHYVINNYVIDGAGLMDHCLPQGKTAATCTSSVFRNDRKHKYITIFHLLLLNTNALVAQELYFLVVINEITSGWNVTQYIASVSWTVDEITQIMFLIELNVFYIAFPWFPFDA